MIADDVVFYALTGAFLIFCFLGLRAFNRDQEELKRNYSQRKDEDHSEM